MIIDWLQDSGLDILTALISFDPFIPFHFIKHKGVLVMKAIQIHAHGGPDVLKYEDVTLSVPGRGELRIRIKAIGLNFIDV